MGKTLPISYFSQCLQKSQKRPSKGSFLVMLTWSSPEDENSPWPPTRQAETGTDLPLSPSHLKAIKDFISIGLQENSGSAPLFRVGPGT